MGSSARTEHERCLAMRGVMDNLGANFVVFVHSIEAVLVSVGQLCHKISTPIEYEIVYQWICFFFRSAECSYRHCR